MARKDLLKSVMGDTAQSTSGSERSSYAMRGASKSMKVSIDSLAENSKRLLEGETIVEINTDLIDASFVNDRLSGDDDAFDELKSSIAASGQDTPILLRPHPEASGRYMIVFGHRRVRVARALGRPVRTSRMSSHKARRIQHGPICPSLKRLYSPRTFVTLVRTRILPNRR